MKVLSIDQGTTSTRALLFYDDGSTEVVHISEHRQIYPRDGWVEHDPEELLDNIRRGIVAGKDADVIGIDNQGESCLAWHADTGEAISPVLVWQDNRTEKIITHLCDSGAGTLVTSKTGLPLDAYFSASKLGWIYGNVPAARSLHRQGKLRLGTTDAWFLQKLTGHCVTDITTASRTSLMNIETGDWDQDLCRLFNVPQDSLPPIVSTTGDFGSVASDNNRSIPVGASVVDQQASLYGHGCRVIGDCKITFGTGAFALAVTGNRIYRAPNQGLLPTVAWQAAGESPQYALDGGVYCAASAINWARSLGLFQSLDQINAFSGPSAIERGIVFVPALSGLACPHWDRSAGGMWLGLRLSTQPLDMVQAILEGVAFRTAEVIEAMARFVPSSGPISIDGGMSSNPWFCQFLANVLQRGVTVSGFPELTAMGVALLASGDAISRDVVVRQRMLYEPQQDMTAHRERFARAVSRTRDWHVSDQRELSP